MNRKINIEIIPHEEQRYNTAGDYIENVSGGWDIKVSSLKGDTDPKLSRLYESLIAIHELAELTMLEFVGVSEPDVMKHDLMFGEEQERGLHKPDEEPGDDPRSPYKIEHQTAETIERTILSTLGLSFTDYDKYFWKTLHPQEK